MNPITEHEPDTAAAAMQDYAAVPARPVEPLKPRIVLISVKITRTAR